MKPTIDKKHDIDEQNRPSRFLIRIRLRGQPQTNLFDPGNFRFRVGDWVLVESKEDLALGCVASNKIPNVRKDCTSSQPKVVRLAQEKDFEWAERKEAFEHKAKQICLEQIQKLSLPMNLSRVAQHEDSHKITFYFTAEGRVDFRELVRVLAHNLRSRIEMRQVGVRDEAKVIAGYGVCGQTLCCSTFLDEFSPVTIRMAKDQGLALNPSKISGVCGRLMCCLQYEHDIYRNLVKLLPRIGSRVETPEGWGKVIKNNILEKVVTVILDDESYMTYHLSELKNFVPPDSIEDESLTDHSKTDPIQE